MAKGAEWKILQRLDGTNLSDPFEKHPEFVPLSLWMTDDSRPHRANEKWVNALLRKAGFTACKSTEFESTIDDMQEVLPRLGESQRPVNEQEYWVL